MVKFRKSAHSAYYTGIDPTGRRGFLRCPVTALTPEELRAWQAVDPATVAKYVYMESLEGIELKYEKRDNTPDKPIPRLTNGGKRK